MSDVMCDVCLRPNTEFAVYEKEVDLQEVRDRVSIKPTNYIRSVITRYIRFLLEDPIPTKTNVCQSCVSKSFRSFKKGV